MLDPRASEDEIAAMARHYAGRARTLLYSSEQRATGLPTTSDALARALDALALECHAKPVAPDVSLSGRIQRMTDVRWWMRNLRRQLLRENEATQQALGNVRRSKDCYVTEHAMRRKKSRAKINRMVLEAREVVNEEGLALNLAEVADKSISNPKLRRAELMVRCRGFEEVAAFERHEAVFLTITCPSRFHRFDAAGNLNKRWSPEHTPRAAQDYLCRVWARIRAQLARMGIAPYGFRVAEPHHDGCPHWHLLLFVPAKRIGWFMSSRFIAGRKDFGGGLLGVVGRYALEDSSEEPGAGKHRFKCERIDRSKGSATGYMAKYICKNVDGLNENGEDIGLDFGSGKKTSEAATRVKVWASTWGIRQFQQIGGPSVTVWRELRRVAEDAQQPVLDQDIFEGPRSAADRAIWALFWILQGGPEVPRSALTLRPMYVLDECSGRYGDDVKRIRGVLGCDEASGGTLPLVTRMHTWTVQTSGRAVVDAEMHAWRSVLTTRRKHPELWAAMQRIEAEKGLLDLRSGEAVAPWTRVNNCTRTGDRTTVSSETPFEKPVSFNE